MVTKEDVDKAKAAYNDAADAANAAAEVKAQTFAHAIARLDRYNKLKEEFENGN